MGKIGDLKGRVDLPSVVAMDLGPAVKRSGRWVLWLCPFHGERTPSLGVTSAPPRYKCFGCGASGDVLDWLMEYRHLDQAEALAELERLAALPDMPRPQIEGGEVAESQGPPSEKWQRTGIEFCKWARPLLWEPVGAPGLAYLRAGGLTEATIGHYGLGWSPIWQPRQSERWGLEGPRPVWLPRGVVIPVSVAGTLWAVKVRAFDRMGRPVTEGQKYGGPRGSISALFGADDFKGGERPLLLCEGERDVMLAWQELGDLVDVATLGGAAKRGLGRWVLWLLPYRKIVVAYDADPAGIAGAEALRRGNRRIQVAAVPHGGDLTGFHVGGGDLRAWVGAAIK